MVGSQIVCTAIALLLKVDATFKHEKKFKHFKKKMYESANASIQSTVLEMQKVCIENNKALFLH